MQYLLSKEEYTELVDRAAKAEAEKRNEIEALCVQVANLTLVDYGFGGEVNLMPHGCIHNEELIDELLDGENIEYESEEWYTEREKLEVLHPEQQHCDTCPVRNVCPLPHSYSK